MKLCMHIQSGDNVCSRRAAVACPALEDFKKYTSMRNTIYISKANVLSFIFIIFQAIYLLHIGQRSTINFIICTPVCVFGNRRIASLHSTHRCRKRRLQNYQISKGFKPRTTKFVVLRNTLQLGRLQRSYQRSSMAPRSVRFGVRSRKTSHFGRSLDR
jgi:hypothetical protein